MATFSFINPKDLQEISVVNTSANAKPLVDNPVDKVICDKPLVDNPVVHNCVKKRITINEDKNETFLYTPPNSRQSSNEN